MNHYQPHIESLFTRILELRHTSSLINSTLAKSAIELESNQNSIFESISALAINDWTEHTEDGWRKYSYAGFPRRVSKENYSEEVQRIISQECCLAFAQSFEALERFFKDCVFNKLQFDENYRIKNKFSDLTIRSDLPGGNNLFKLLKKAAGPGFNNASNLNNRNINFQEFWIVLSEVRHSVTHSISIIKSSKVSKIKYNTKIFESFFDFKNLENGTIKIILHYSKLDKILTNILEFAFQMFKILSNEDGLYWQILKN